MLYLVALVSEILVLAYGKSMMKNLLKFLDMLDCKHVTGLYDYLR